MNEVDINSVDIYFFSQSVVFIHVDNHSGYITTTSNMSPSVVNKASCVLNLVEIWC